MLKTIPQPYLVRHIVLLNDNVVKTFSHLATRPGKRFLIFGDDGEDDKANDGDASFEEGEDEGEVNEDASGGENDEVK